MGLAEREGAVYTDGAGSEQWVPKSAARVGAGAAAFSTEPLPNGSEGWRFKDVSFLFAGVPGRQTVPRAETTAALRVLQQEWQQDGAKRLVVDASYVEKGFPEEARHQRCQGANGDLWNDLDTHEQGQFDIAKCTSHTTLAQVVAGKVPLQEYIGNNLADIAAGVAAQLHRLPWAILEYYDEWFRTATAICIRLAMIEADGWERREKEVDEPVLPPLPQPRSAAQHAGQIVTDLTSKGHVIARFGNGFRCSRCGLTSPAKRLQDTYGNTCKAQVVREDRLRRQLEDSRRAQAAAFAEDFEQEEDLEGEFQEPPTEPQAEEEDHLWPAPEEPTQRISRARASGMWQQHKATERRLIAQDNAAKLQATQTAASLLTRQNPSAVEHAVFAPQEPGPPPGAAPARRPQIEDCLPQHTDDVDRSHKLHFTGGFLFCANCATISSSDRYGRLHEPCKKVAAEGSKPRMKLLREGRLPKRWSAWPDGQSEAAASRNCYTIGWGADGSANKMLVTRDWARGINDALE